MRAGSSGPAFPLSGYFPYAYPQQPPPLPGTTLACPSSQGGQKEAVPPGRGGYGPSVSQPAFIAHSVTNILSKVRPRAADEGGRMRVGSWQAEEASAYEASGAGAGSFVPYLSCFQHPPA